MRILLILLNMTGVPRLVIRLVLDKRVPARLKLILLVALIYLISPLDLVSDIVPVLGRLDDVVAIIVALILFLGMAPKHLVSEHARRRSDRRPSSGEDSNVIEGSYRFTDETKD